MPRHVAIIMDGNNRWAKKRLLPGVAGPQGRYRCRQGGDRGLRRGRGRGPHPVRVLQRELAASGGRSQRADGAVSRGPAPRGALDENGIRLRIIGDRTRFHPELQAAMREAEAATAGNTRFLLQVAANYGVSGIIVQAAQRLAREIRRAPGGGRYLRRAAQGCLVTGDQPLPDLCIPHRRRASHQQFPPPGSWLCRAVFLRPVLADFKHAAMRAALAQFSKRQRRFGKTSDSKSRPRPVRHAESTDHHGAGAPCPSRWVSFSPSRRGVLRPVHRRW